MHIRTQSQTSSHNASLEKHKQVLLNKALKQVDDRVFFEIEVRKVSEEFQQRIRRHLSKAVLPCDAPDRDDTQCVVEYQKDILDHYLKTELENQPRIKYMQLQKHISERMRSILIDWIIEVHF